MERCSRIGLFLAGAVSLVMASLPYPPALPGNPSDKLLHILAFSVLGTLAATGFPRLGITALFASLTLFGALIELIQTIPALNRNGDLNDLGVDMIAAFAALLLTRVVLRRLG